MAGTELTTPSGRRVLAPEPAGPLPEAPAAPTFSVIVAAHNTAGTIRETVETALDQTHPAHEVIVCDDASPADERAALEGLLDRVVYLSNERNLGIGGAKRTAAEAATGDYVVAVDADDAMKPTRLESLAELVRLRPDLDIVNTEADMEVDGVAVRHAYQDDWPFPVEGQREEILRRCFISPGGAVKRSRLVEVGSFAPLMVLFEDWDLYARLILTGSRAGLVDEPLLRYRIHPGQASASWTSKLHRGEAATLLRIVEHPSLSGHERGIVEATLAETRRRLARAEAREVLLEGGQAARQTLLAVARDGEQPLPARAKALASAASPALAGALMRRRARRSWQGSAGVRVERP